MIRKANRINEIKEYYFSKKLKEIDELKKRGFSVINLGIGNPDLPPPGETVKKLVESCEKDYNHGYQEYRGIRQLRSAFSQWYRQYYNVNLDPEKEILTLMGSKEGIFYISMAFLNPEDKVLVPDPGYPAYKSVTTLVGAKPISYDLTEDKHWFPDFDTLESTDLSKVKIMWVNYPHMPTGARGTRELFFRLIEFGKKHRILICNDNPYSFILNDDPLSIFEVEGSKEVALELNSLSKAYNMAGWRMGMVAGKTDFIQDILKITSNIQSGMFLPIQFAAVEALKNPPSWFKKLNSIYLKRKQLVWKLLNKLDCMYDKDQAGIFIWAKVPGNMNSIEFSDYLLNEFKLFITPGAIFGANGEKYIRISLCSNEQKINESIDRVSKWK